MKVKNIMITGKGESVEGIRFIAEDNREIFQLGEAYNNLKSIDVVHEVNYGGIGTGANKNCWIDIPLDRLIEFLRGSSE